MRPLLDDAVEFFSLMLGAQLTTEEKKDRVVLMRQL
jgi:hypothetical protein